MLMFNLQETSKKPFQHLQNICLLCSFGGTSAKKNCQMLKVSILPNRVHWLRDRTSMPASTSFPIAVVVWDQKYKNHPHVWGTRLGTRLGKKHMTSHKKGYQPYKTMQFYCVLGESVWHRNGLALSALEWNGPIPCKSGSDGSDFLCFCVLCTILWTKESPKHCHKYLVIQSDLFRMVKWPFQRLSDLQLGDEKVTLNHLVQYFSSPRLVQTSLNCSKVFETLAFRRLTGHVLQSLGCGTQGLHRTGGLRTTTRGWHLVNSLAKQKIKKNI